MTKDKIDLHALVGKTADGDFLRDMIGFAAQRLMELEVGGLTGAGYGEKDADISPPPRKGSESQSQWQEKPLIGSGS